MTSHYNIATEGARAGHKFFAKLGFGWKIEVSITPIDTGGASSLPWIPDTKEYLVTVKITKKNKQWSQSFKASEFELKSLAKIVLTFKQIKRIFNNVSISIKQRSINISNIFVKVFKK